MVRKVLTRGSELPCTGSTTDAGLLSPQNLWWIDWPVLLCMCDYSYTNERHKNNFKMHSNETRLNKGHDTDDKTWTSVRCNPGYYLAYLTDLATSF